MSSSKNQREGSVLCMRRRRCNAAANAASALTFSRGARKIHILGAAANRSKERQKPRRRRASIHEATARQRAGSFCKKKATAAGAAAVDGRTLPATAGPSFHRRELRRIALRAHAAATTRRKRCERWLEAGGRRPRTHRDARHREAAARRRRDRRSARRLT